MAGLHQVAPPKPMASKSLRSGSSLYTAEGNWGGEVVVANGAYTVNGNALYRNGTKFRSFSVGYHMQ